MLVGLERSVAGCIVSALDRRTVVVAENIRCDELTMYDL